MTKKSRLASRVSVRRWVSYAAAAAATSLAATNDADAAIVYSGPLNVTASGGTGYAPAKFVFKTLIANSQPGANPLFSVSHRVNNPNENVNDAFMHMFVGTPRSVKGKLSLSLYAYKLPAGANLVNGSKFYGIGNGLAELVAGYSGYWQAKTSQGGGQAGYLGFKFKFGGNTEYGWLRMIPLSASPKLHNFLIEDYAYTTGATPSSFRTGQMPVITPEPASLGLLALGAAGLLAFRGGSRKSNPDGADENVAAA